MWVRSDGATNLPREAAVRVEFSRVRMTNRVLWQYFSRLRVRTCARLGTQDSMPMTKKLVWPATLSASLALAAACGGGSSPDGMGGEGGSDGSSGGNASGGSSSGGSSADGGLGGMGGDGPIIIIPETCSDELENEDETDVDCGGPDCDPCADDATCAEDADCESGVCEGETCREPNCGDGVVNADDEECDDGRETAKCTVDCKLSVCGDGYINERAGEVCEPDPDLGIWQRCGRTCIYGVDLDGTWRDTNLEGTESPWEMLPVTGGEYRWLPTFHYLEESSIIELFGGNRFDIRDSAWRVLGEDPGMPARAGYSNGASDGEKIWIVLDTTMYTFDIASEIWTPHTNDVPRTDLVTGSGVVHDGDGLLWYVGHDATLAADALVRFDPSDGTYTSFLWTTEVPAYTAFEVRMAYDPLGDSVLLGTYSSHSTFLEFDLATESFTETIALPDGGAIQDATCQDRAGGIYVVSNAASATEPFYKNAYRYDVAAGTYTQLPTLPVDHDYTSSCVVSEAGYLYYGTEYGAFARLRLNHH